MDIQGMMTNTSYDINSTTAIVTEVPTSSAVIREVSRQTPDQKRKTTPGTIHPDRSRVRLLAYLVTARSRCCSPLEERRTQFSTVAGYRSRHLQWLVDSTAHQVRPGISGLVAGPGQTHWSVPLPRSDIVTFSTSNHWTAIVEGYQACNFFCDCWFSLYSF